MLTQDEFFTESSLIHYEKLNYLSSVLSFFPYSILSFYLSVFLSFSSLSLPVCVILKHIFFSERSFQVSQKEIGIEVVVGMTLYRRFLLKRCVRLPLSPKKRPTYTMIVRSTINQLVEAVSLRHDQVK